VTGRRSDPQPVRLTESTLVEACSELGVTDPDLFAVLARLGPPPLWDREPGFPTLIRIILEQQVSLASAKAAFVKLTDKTSPLDPAAFLTLDDATLNAIGFSGQKGRYCRELAKAVLDGSLDLGSLASLNDDQVRSELIKVTGIGPWTADIYLLMALGRPDVWPRGDLALRKAVQDLKGLASPPTQDEFDVLGERWRPWRSVAARILWNHYLNPGNKNFRGVSSPQRSSNDWHLPTRTDRQKSRSG
jgi:DNA-3-methyladenine glycosylase II